MGAVGAVKGGGVIPGAQVCAGPFGGQCRSGFAMGRL